MTQYITCTGFLRLPDVLKVIPVKRSTWFAGVKKGKYPSPVRIGERAVAWRVEDIKKLIEDLGKGGKNE